MRSPTRRFLLIGIALALCSMSHGAPKIGVLLKAHSPFWDALEQGAREAGSAAGAEIVVKAPLSEIDAAVQIQLLNALVAQGAQAIVIAPINREALTGPVAALVAKGVKVVVVDTPLGDNAAPVFVGTDQKAAGEAAGNLLANLVSEGDAVSVFRFAQNSGATNDRENAAIAAFRAARHSNVVFADIYATSFDSTETTQAALLLKRHPNVKAVLASNTTATMAMLKALEDQKLTSTIKLIGFGFNLNREIAAAIDQGILSGWVAQLPKEIGAKGVAAAVHLLQSEPVPSVINTNVVIVTKANLNDPKTQALLAQ